MPADVPPMPLRSNVSINSGTPLLPTEATLVNPHLETDRLRLIGRKKKKRHVVRLQALMLTSY